MEGQIEKEPPGKAEGDKLLSSKCGLWTYYSTQDGSMSRMFCKSWRCETCKEKRALAVRDKFIELGRLYNLTRFLTLTIDPKVVKEEFSCSADMRQRYLKLIWNKFVTNMKKNWSTFEFLWVMEWHKKKDGFPHLHVMLSSFMPKKRIEKAWKSAGGGFIKIKRAKDDDALAQYCCKYMAKDVILSVASLARGTRIWGRSRQLKTIDELVSFMQTSDWIVIKDSIENLRVREKYYGETQQEREDMEATCRPILESCLEASLKDLETQVTAYKHEESRSLEED